MDCIAAVRGALCMLFAHSHEPLIGSEKPLWGVVNFKYINVTKLNTKEVVQQQRAVEGFLTVLDEIVGMEKILRS